jgi:hypothetical protein
MAGAQVPIPQLTEADVTGALSAAKKRLDATGRATLRNGLNEALRNYVVERLLEAQRVNPSQLAKPLERVGRCARGLVAGLQSVDVVSDAANKEVLKHTVCYVGRLRAILGMPADMQAFDVPKHAADVLQQLAEVFGDAASDAQNTARRRSARSAQKVSSGKARAPRHATDKATVHFFATLNGLWIELLGEIPGATWDAYSSADKAGGSYIGFAERILRSYAGRIPDEVEAFAPGIQAKLRLSRAAIHARFRQTGISGLRRIAKSVSDSD